MIQRMVALRAKRGESQRQLSKAIGYHQTQIARYETGVNIPPIDYLIKFCEHYNVSADYLLGLPRGLDWPVENGKNEE